MKGFGPRLGFAYALNSKTIIRASGGIYYSDQPVQAGIPPASRRRPVSVRRINYTPVYNWGTASFPQNYNRPPQLIPEFQNNQSITWLLPDGTRLPQIMSWTIGIQRELAPNLALDVAYIGSHSTHLAAGSNFNFVDKKYLSLGNLLLQTAGSPGAAAANVPVPFPAFPDLLAEHRGAGAHAVPAVHLRRDGRRERPGGQRAFQLPASESDQAIFQRPHAARFLDLDEEHEHSPEHTSTRPTGQSLTVAIPRRTLW